MLEQLLIFTRGGLILWTCQELGNALRGSPIDALIRSCLLEQRSASAAFHYEAPGASYTLKWSFHNELGLLFVAVYQRMLHLLYVDELLSMVKREFALIYNPKQTDYPAFDDTFRQLLREAEARASELRTSKQTPPAVGSVKKGGLKSDRSHAKGGKENGHTDIGGGDDENDGDGSGPGNSKNGMSSRQSNGKIHHVEASSTASSSDEDGGAKKAVDNAFDVNKLQKLKAKGKKGAAPAGALSKASKAELGKKKKQNRVWNDGARNSKLDFTDPVDESGEIELIAAGFEEGKSLMDAEDANDYDTEQEEEGENKGKPVSEKKSWFSSLMESVSGKSVIDEKDLEPKLKTLKDRLMMKNVAEEIAEELCNSVGASLVGKKLGSFTRVSSTVLAAMEEALVRILTPKRSIDILRDVHGAKEQGRPYVIVFVGVNGVGKSTNLAKVAYWLLQHDISVMMAACDTFRSGAVEQLRTHARRLKIPVFERGYEKDPALVAQEAIKDACNKTDVVLVDTAGRMQDNEPLMRALSKLVNKNNPDLVLFVGEALVGNDGVDQLMKFNQKLSDLSPSGTPRMIDGILLTKFDTVDDKVGAALSMVYKSGAPIMFVGCGQTYTDLKKLNVKSLIKSLLK